MATGISLPAGFCATVFADNLGRARHLTTSPTGDVFVILSRIDAHRTNRAIVALRDSDRDGRADIQVSFGNEPGDDIEWRDEYLYYSSPMAIRRFRMAPRALEPTSPPETVVSGFPAFSTPEHDSKSFAFGSGSDLLVHVGAPSNACQERNRHLRSPGITPCPLLDNSAGVWRFSSDRLEQNFREGRRVASGLRHAFAIGTHPESTAIIALQHGRDLLHMNWPEVFSSEQNADLPSDEILAVTEGADFGWPYCFHDGRINKRVLAPEYGGNGTAIGQCAGYRSPLAALPAHSAPNDIVFYRGSTFPEGYRRGAFVALHGGWGRIPFPQRGYAVVFLAFDVDGTPIGVPEPFADGFGGDQPVFEPRFARFRPVGLAVAPDGALFISDSKVGRVWRIVYSGA